MFENLPNLATNVAEIAQNKFIDTAHRAANGDVDVNEYAHQKLRMLFDIGVGSRNGKNCTLSNDFNKNSCENLTPCASFFSCPSSGHEKKLAHGVNLYKN